MDEDHLFDVLLARECRVRGLARSAPLLARGMATQRLHETGRDLSKNNDDLRRKFIAEALRELRIDALVSADRTRDPKAVKALFDHRYGVGGVRVSVRQILVSFAATKDRLATAGEPADDTATRAAARKRAQELRMEIQAGRDFASLLAKSDDRITRRLLRDPARSASAGFLKGYNYTRYGENFASVVRGMGVGEVSAPVESNVGFHLVHLVDREITRFEDVEARLRQEVGRRRATPPEVLALRKALFGKYRSQTGSERR